MISTRYLCMSSWQNPISEKSFIFSPGQPISRACRLFWDRPRSQTPRLAFQPPNLFLCFCTDTLLVLLPLFSGQSCQSFSQSPLCLHHKISCTGSVDGNPNGRSVTAVCFDSPIWIFRKYIVLFNLQIFWILHGAAQPF